MKLAIIGYGKIGRTIEEFAREAGHEIVLTIGSNNAGDLTEDRLKDADVAVEFTRPEVAVEHLLLCFRAGVPVVSGTTGWLDELEVVLQEREKQQGGFFYASNFSIGVNLTFAVNRVLARLMNDHDQYEVTMREIHHTQKLDAPSGTAITLAEGITVYLDRKNKWVSGAEAKPSEVPIISERTGDVPGTHEVTYRSPIDTITLKHEAHSREGFAKGALKAAEWMNGRSGYFGMADLLGIK
jgi:4-hydroxy-tetrahydrodipicolinate reductase